ncbi:MAG TPA: PAS domain S-box protein [Opitutaceae bacterium]|nr:PAS domain S-box protein [Opitutaceae bacterium]
MLRWISTGCAGYAAISGAFGFWRAANADAFTPVATVPMAASTGVILLLLGAAVAAQPHLATKAAYRILAYTIGATIAIGALLVIARDTIGFSRNWAFWMPESSTTVGGTPTGRMSPFTAAALLLLVVGQQSLLPALAFRAGARRAAMIGVLAVLLFVALSASAYAMGAPLLADIGVVPMALSTSAALAALGVALLVLGHAEGSTGDLLETVQGKLLASFAAVIVLLTFVASIAYAEFAEIRLTQRRLLERNFTAVLDVSRLRANLNAERLDVSLMFDLPAAAREPWRRDHDQRTQEDEQILRRLPALLAGHAESSRLLTALTTLRAEYEQTCRGEILPALARGDLAAAKRLYLGPQTERHLRLRELTRSLEARETVEARAIVAQADTRAGLSLGVLLGAGSASIAGAMAVGLFMFRAIGRYVTERQRAEERLRRNAVFLEQTQEITQVGGWEFDLAENRLTWSDELYRIHEISRDHDVRLPAQALAFYTGDDHARMTTAFQDACQRGVPYDLELALTTAKGNRRWVRTIGRAEKNNGAVVRVFGSVTDITEQRRAADAIEAERRRFNEVLNALPVYVILLTPDYHVRFANTFFEQRFGQAKGRRCYEYLFNRTEPCEICETYKVLKTHAPLQWKWTGPDGRHYDIHDEPFTDVDGSTLILEVGIDETETRNAQRALEEASAYNRSLIEASLDPLVTIGADGRIMDANAATETATGRPRAELIGTDFSECFTDPPLARVGLQRAFRDGTVRDIALEVRPRDGATIAVVYNASVYRNTSGAVAGVVAAARDITARRKAELELRRTNRALRATTACNQAIVHARTESDLLRDVCRVIVEDGGYRMAWVGRAEHDAEKTIVPVAMAGHESGYLGRARFTWADNEFGRGPTGTAIRTGNPAVCRDMLVDPRFAPWRAEAQTRGYASSIVLPLTVEQAMFGAISIYAAEPDAFDAQEAKWLAELGEDVAHGIEALRLRDQRERAEQALQAASRYNRSLIEATLDPMVTIGPDGKITDANTSTEAITGRTRDELIGSDFSSYFTEAANARAGYEQVFREGTVRDYPLECRHRTGKVTPVLYNATVYRDQAGHVAGVLATARDITEAKRAEEKIRGYALELERSNQELERFAYVASHDLQEPLRTVSSFSQLLGRQYREKLDRDADEFIGFIVSGAERMQTLINDLLVFSRIGTRAKPFSTVDADAVLAAVLANLDASIRETQTIVTHDPLPQVQADATQLTQLLQNLVGNAIKFRRSGIQPQVHVGATRVDGGWEFSIRDNGVGIEPQYFERIFIIFQRLHGLNEYPGTGIGLAICKKIVERHGGRIRVESEAGAGSTFHFTLPDTPPHP